MEGCGPCNATKPEWAKLKNVMSYIKRLNNIAIVEIDQLLSNKIEGQTSPSGFPTMRFITNGGKTVENFEDSNIKNKERTVDCFVDWIKSKTNDQHIKSHNKNIHKNTHKNIHKYTHKRNTRHNFKHLRGGKWSQKYKDSINCKRPRGFSQKQHCKYGRNK
jgi:hypothetical protein